jgi:hypothetical protein
MKRRRNEGEPAWPPHLAEYRPADGWKSEFDWEIERVKFARAQGFKNFKMLPILQRMVTRATGVESNNHENDVR